MAAQAYVRHVAVDSRCAVAGYLLTCIISCICRDLQQDSHRCSTTAAAEKNAMQTEIHELQMSISDTKKSMQSKIAQLEEQITVLKADKSAAVQKCEQISAEWTEAKCRVSEEHVAVERMQLQLQDQSRVWQQYKADISGTMCIGLRCATNCGTENMKPSGREEHGDCTRVIKFCGSF